MNTNLHKYGLTPRFEQEATLYQPLYLARITRQHRELYTVVCQEGELIAAVSGKLAHNAAAQTDYPVVGDWVMIDRQSANTGNAVIHHILSRKTLLTRQEAGSAAAQQAIAANIDTIFICMSLNADFNLRRLERYLAIAWDSMATPVIVLTKADLCQDLPQKMHQLLDVSVGVDTLYCSAQNPQSLNALTAYVQPGTTVAFIGSSGVGKSTLINRLMGTEVLHTQTIRQKDDRGRHTTTHRQLLALPGGGVVIDTPGMRELQIYTGNISKTFEDIEELAALCKYSDCSHNTEPGCAIQAAIQNGSLPQKRYESWQKLRRELTYSQLNSRQTENEKISRMFGSKKEMKQFMAEVKHKNHRKL